MAGDGVFKWYWGLGQEPEVCYGEVDSREEILQIAMRECDGEGFTILEADKSVPSFHVFNAECVVENYIDENAECWGEDGPELHPDALQESELEQMLAATFKSWMEKHRLVKTWSFGTVRNQEYFHNGESK